jgi:interleukin-1 receptor-associated kinase 1
MIKKNLSVSNFNHYFAGFKLNPMSCLAINHYSLTGEEPSDVHEITFDTSQRFEEVPRDDSFHLKDSTGYEENLSLRSISVIRRELPESALGWPLLQRTNRPALEALRSSEVRTMSLVEWNSKENNSSSDLKTDDCIVKKCKTEGTVIQLFHASETESRDGSSSREDENFGFKQKVSSNFDFLLTKESTRSGPGWLLFRIKTSASPESLQESQADGLSVVQWVLSLPNRSKEATTNIQIDVVSKEAESYVENNICGHEDKHSEACLAASMKLPKKLGCFFKLCSSGCKQFSYEELRRETHHFSSVLILSF